MTSEQEVERALLTILFVLGGVEVICLTTWYFWKRHKAKVMLKNIPNFSTEPLTSRHTSPDGRLKVANSEHLHRSWWIAMVCETCNMMRYDVEKLAYHLSGYTQKECLFYVPKKHFNRYTWRGRKVKECPFW